jgi:2-dehydropantoate 2-reductase
LYYGALLQRAGNEVRFLLRRDYEAIMANGLHVYSSGGNFHLPHVAGALTPEEIGPVNLVLVGLKTFANDRFADLIAPLVNDTTTILSLQNGLGNEEALAGLFGAERVMGGVAYLCANRGEPGTVHHLGKGRVLLGEYASAGMERAERIAALFRAAGIDCRAVDDLRRARWEKLVWNIPFNGLSALTGCPVDRLLATEESTRLVREIMLEVIAAANAQKMSSPIPDEFSDEMLRFSANMGPYRPSMLIDRVEGRPLELGAIFDRPIACGGQRSMPMPRTAMLAACLHLMTGPAPAG